MSRNILKDIAPFSVTLLEDGEFSNKDYLEDLEGNETKEIDCVEENEDVLEMLSDYLVIDNNFGIKVTQPLRGWSAVKTDKFPSKKNELYGVVLQKSDHVVGLVNTNDYGDVGYLTLVAVSKKKESLEEFLKDFEITDSKIEKNQILTMIS